MRFPFTPALALVALAACSPANVSTLPAASSNGARGVAIAPRTSFATVYAFKYGPDGGLPQAALTFVGGALYGTTNQGGNGRGCSFCGTVYKLAPSGSGFAESVLYRFPGGLRGQNPAGALLAGKNGALYGTTEFGGASNAGYGIVFELKPAAHGYAESVLYSFKGGSDGAIPIAGLIADANGTLYGTTQSGGATPCGYASQSNYGCGTVFKLVPSGATYKETVLYRFQSGADGAQPQAPLVERSGVLYGTTTNGGQNPSCTQGCGTAFRLTPSGSGYAEAVIYRFRGKSDGANPNAAMIWSGATPALYGTTYAGGTGACTNGCGTAFRLAPSGTKYVETVLYRFPGTAGGGQAPAAALLAYGGRLYGSSSGGFNNLGGTLFTLTPSGTNFTEQTLFALPQGTNGGVVPRAALIADGATLFGTTYGGGGIDAACGTGQCGTVFKVVP